MSCPVMCLKQDHPVKISIYAQILGVSILVQSTFRILWRFNDHCPSSWKTLFIMFLFAFIRYYLQGFYIKNIPHCPLR